MYTEADRTAIRGQMTRRMLAVWLPAAVLIVTALTALIWRTSAAAHTRIDDPEALALLRKLEWITYICGGGAAVWLILADGLLVSPLRKYRRYLSDVLDGLRHETVGDWGGVAGDVSEVNGVRYRAVSLIQQDEKGRPFDRLFYFDCEKELPEIADGTPVRITYHDRMVIGISPVQ